MLTKQEWPTLVRGLNILIPDDDQKEMVENKEMENIFSDQTTIDLQVKSLKGNKLTAKTKIKQKKSNSPSQRPKLD
jgi:hypothetical protein